MEPRRTSMLEGCAGTAAPGWNSRAGGLNLCLCLSVDGVRRDLHHRCHQRDLALLASCCSCLAAEL